MTQVSPVPLLSLIALSALSACRNRDTSDGKERTSEGSTTSVTRSAPASPPPPPAAPLSNQPLIEHTVDGHRIRLVQEGTTCSLVVAPSRAAESRDGGEQRVPLALTPPCHLLLWAAPPPARAGAPSDGVAIGNMGQPMAWRYPGVRGATIVAVIGDPISEERRADPIVRKRLDHGLRCAPAIQAVLLTANGAKATKKRADFGLTCVEGGVDEKVFWILAHD